MQQVRLILSLYYFPVYFFTLALSPNINGERIGVVLLTVFACLIPLVNIGVLIVSKKQDAIRKSMFWWKILLAIILLFGLGYFSWQINWQFLASQLLYLFGIVGLTYLFPSRRLTPLFSITIGALLFSAIYLGLNQYGFTQLFSVHNMILATLCGVLIAPIVYLEEEKSSIKVNWVFLFLVIEIILFGVFFLVYFNWYYLGFFVVALIPVSVLLFYSRNNRIEAITPNKSLLIKLSYSLCLAGFFIYFFLDSTQVLQAIQGGY